MQSYAAYEGSTIQFCRDFSVPQQTLYSQLKRRQVATINKRDFANVKVSIDESSFVKAQVPLSNIVLHTEHAKLCLSGQCDPLWLATLLKGLSE